MNQTALVALKQLLTGLVVTALTAVAVAEPGIIVPSDDLAIGILHGMLATELLESSGKPSRRAAQAVPGSSTVVQISSAAVMPAKLAAHLPAQQQPSATRTYQQVLDGYRQIETRLRVPRNDLAGAVAAFIAGSWMAYRDRDLPDEHFAPLVRQMRQIIGSNADFRAAGQREKQEMYEQMAILGTSMALTREGLKRQPDARTQARMRDAAKGYLEQFLKTDADRVDISAQGLSLR